MKKIYYSAFFAGILLFSTIITSCEEKPKYREAAIIIYGEALCNHCYELKQDLKESNIAFTFKDLTEGDGAYEKEMLDTLKALGIPLPVSTPVVAIKDVVLQQPTAEQLIEIAEK